MQNQTQIRVPVLDINGQPIMPTKASRARRWLRDGKAKAVHNDLGVFQIQLLKKASGNEQQDIVVGIDQGKLYTGMAVQSSKNTLLMLHLELPFLIVKKRMEQRKLMRNNRRRRRINRKVQFNFRNHRQNRFSNRKHKGQLPPSIKSNKQLEQRVVTELCKLFPVTKCVFELVKTYGRKGFSEVMCGQNLQVKWLETILPTETIFGWKTSILRDKLGLIKNKSHKKNQEPATHAIDGVALACHHFIKYVEDKVNRCGDWFGGVVVTKSQFVVVGRPKYSRRQLHLMTFSKGHVRRNYGGSSTINNLRKGDLVAYTYKDKSIVGYCSGSTGKRLSISNADWSRIDRFSATNCRLIHRSCGLTVKVIKMSD
jgi:hypothetical protein